MYTDLVKILAWNINKIVLHKEKCLLFLTILFLILSFVPKGVDVVCVCLALIFYIYTFKDVPETFADHIMDFVSTNRW